MNQKLLVVDDEDVLRESIVEILNDEQYEIFQAATAESAIDLFKTNLPQLVLLDINLPDMNGLDLLQQMKLINPGVIVVMLTAYGSMETVVSAMRLGAKDYLIKPLYLEELKIAVKQLFEEISLRSDLKRFIDLSESQWSLDNIIGSSSKMKVVKDLIAKVAKSPASTVLVQGESGTGKELVAKAIHFLSHRKMKPCLDINCSAISENLLESELFGHIKGSFTDAKNDKEGLFEASHEGTLFLDEVGDMPLSMQVKLLRVLQNKKIRRVGDIKDIEIDVRLIAATNRNLSELIQKGQFREDLYYRLNVIPIILPPLRERDDDLKELIHYYIQYFNKEFNRNILGISKEAYQICQNYSWPGNIRELKNVIERIVLLEETDVIKPQHLIFQDTSIQKDKSKFNIAFNDPTLENVEKMIIQEVLSYCKNNKNSAAKMLQINRTTLYSKIKKYNLLNLE